MSYLETLAQVDDLRATIAAQSPLPAETLKKLNYKFRLEWNYTSNSMEGNTLTKSETRSVMIGNITVNGKPIKDVLEVKGHDEVISTILKMGSGNTPLSETRIRDIHRGIMHEEDPKKAEYIGKWKPENNYLLNYKGERIDFTPATEVPDAMHKLTDWLAAEREKIAREDATALHPARLAFEFHLKYVSIHPFYDGNGRTARIFTNIILIAYGYPPIWVNDGPEKTEYYQYLADVQGYGGSPDIFYDLMTGLLLRSQQLMLDAVEGREIEEPSDIDKEIALFKKSLDRSLERKEIKSNANVMKVVEHSAIPLFEMLKSKLSQFDELFHVQEDRIVTNSLKDSTYGVIEQEGKYIIPTVLFPQVVYNLLGDTSTGWNTLRTFGFEYLLKGYRLGSPYNLSVFLFLAFGEYDFFIERKSTGGIKNDNPYLVNRYDQQLTEDDILHIVNRTVKDVFTRVKEIADGTPHSL